MVCGHCGYIYCYKHGAAHSGKSCAEYEQSIAREVEESQSVLRQITKPCPCCATPIEKSGGCNHMKCTRCSAAFCWVCGKQIDDDTFPAHFQWWNPTGCVNMQVLYVYMCVYMCSAVKVCMYVYYDAFDVYIYVCSCTYLCVVFIYIMYIYTYKHTHICR